MSKASWAKRMSRLKWRLAKCSTINGIHYSVRRHSRSPAHDVLQFAHVTRERIGHQHVQSVLGEANVASEMAPCEMFDDQRHTLLRPATFSQSRARCSPIRARYPGTDRTSACP